MIRRQASCAALGDVYSRSNNFDVLRFVLATGVIWSHCYALAGRPMDPVFALTRQIDAGKPRGGGLLRPEWLPHHAELGR